MVGRLARLVAALLLIVGAVGSVLVIGMRRKSPLVLDTVRRLNRAVFNPQQMRSAGTPGAYASVIHHRGRSSGRAYETPVGAVSTDEGFVIALPYGTHSDWVKNVLASGSATLVTEGSTYAVDEPEIVSMEGIEAWFPPQDQRSHRLFGVDQGLRLRRVEPAGSRAD